MLQEFVAQACPSGCAFNQPRDIGQHVLVIHRPAYDDWSKADVIFISGCDPYETKTVLFTEWMMGGHQRLIFVMPRKTTGAAYAEKNGGVFLPIIPGTDTILHLALIRLILENGWEDQEFIDRWVANRWEIDSGFGRGTRNTPWQWRTTWGKFGASADEYRKWILANPKAELSAAAYTGTHRAVHGRLLDRIDRLAREQAERAARAVER